MEKWKKALPYYGAMLLNFYLLPNGIADTGSGMLILLAAMPALCVAISVLYGIKHGFHIEYAFIVAALFLPSICIFYNSSAWVYSVGYGALALVGNLISSLFCKRS